MSAYRLRLFLLGTLTVTAFAVLLVRLWWLQIDQKDAYVAKLPTTKEVMHRFPGPRGRILDRNGVELARNRTVYQINLNLGEIIDAFRKTDRFKTVYKRDLPRFQFDVTKEKEVDIVTIVKEMVIAPMSKLGIEAKFTDDSLRSHYRRFERQVPFEFKRDLPWEMFAQIAEHSHQLPGVAITQRNIREYPFGSLAGQLLGYVRLYDNPDNDPDRKSFAFYEGDDYGIADAELYFDKVLRGKPGIRRILVNEHGRLDRVLSNTPPGVGDDVYLTIDIRMQYIAQMALTEAKPSIGRGAVVVSDPNTGEVLAMVAVPNYDPNAFIPSITKEAWAAYNNNETIPMMNRAVRSFAPGSTFKLAVGMAGFLNPGGMSGYYNCDNYVTYGNRGFPCWTVQKSMAGHGSLELTAGIKNSCNCYFYQYGNDAGIKNIQKMGAMLGMGQRTGFELSEELGGRLPGPEWAKANNLPWSKAQVANVSIGQGAVECTPLQLSSMVATIANGRKAYYPTMYHHKYNGVDNTATPFIPKVRTDLEKEGIKAAQVERIRKGMWRVVNEQGGTGSVFKSELPEIKDHGGGAAKTGTAQFKRGGLKDNHTWFVCFAPYDTPQLAVCVLVQGGKSGGGTAAPVAKRVVERSLMLKAGSYTVDPNSIGRVPESKGHFDSLAEVTISYADDNTQHLEPISDDVDTDDTNATEEPVVKGKAVPFATPEPTFSTQTDSAAPKARVVENPSASRYMTNDPTRNLNALPPQPPR